MSFPKTNHFPKNLFHSNAGDLHQRLNPVDESINVSMRGFDDDFVQRSEKIDAERRANWQTANVDLQVNVIDVVSRTSIEVRSNADPEFRKSLQNARNSFKNSNADLLAARQARGAAKSDLDSKKQDIAVQAAKIEAHNFSMTELGAVLQTNLQ